MDFILKFYKSSEKKEGNLGVASQQFVLSKEEM